jgi:RHS repeat-associated protein
MTRVDFVLPGKLPLRWRRHYDTARLPDGGSNLGFGWTHDYAAALIQTEGGYRFQMPEGGEAFFADPGNEIRRSGAVADPGNFQELTFRAGSLAVTRWDPDTHAVQRLTFASSRSPEVFLLASLDDGTPATLDIVRDDQDRIVQIRQRIEGRSVRIEYSSNRISAIRSIPQNDLVVVQFEYDAAGGLSSAYDALGQADRYGYDLDGRLVWEELKDGGRFLFRYDSRGRCTQTSAADGFDNKLLVFQDHLGWTEVTNSAGAKRLYQWNENGQVVSEIEPLGGVFGFKYDEHGRMIEKTAPNGASTVYEYDEGGNRCGITDPLGHRRAFRFDSNHRAIEAQDPLGNVWRRQYDGSGNLSMFEDPEGNKWNYAYDSNGNLLSETLPAGVSRQFHSSDDGLYSERTDFLRNRFTYVHDSIGRVVKVTNPLGDSTEYEYDLLGRMAQATDSSGASNRYTYTPSGKLASLTDARGRTTKWRYGTCGRLLEKTDASGAKTRYRWFSEPGQIESVRNEANQTHLFRYDLNGRLSWEKTFQGVEISYEYGPSGYCVGRTTPMGEFELKRDAAGRLVEEIAPDGSSSRFSYDAFGNLISAENDSCMVEFTRDFSGRVISEKQDDVSVLTEFDLAGAPTKIRSTVGHEAHFSYDANGDFVRVATRNDRMDVLRDANGAVIRWTMAGGPTLSQRRDAKGQLLEQGVRTRPGLPTLVQREYRYDLLGLIEGESDGSGHRSYIYDDLERPVGVVGGERVEYDSSGNITTIVSGAAEKTLHYDDRGRLVQGGSAKFEYDASGRRHKLINEDGREVTYVWDCRDQLVEVQTAEGEVWRYAYDALGRRVRKSGPLGSTRFIWDRDTMINSIGPDGECVGWIFEPDSFRVIGTIYDGALYPVIADYLGTPREILNRDGEVMWSAKYSIWGKATVTTNGRVACAARFQGQWYDEESGLCYNRFRYFDPEHGRYISPDPIGLLGGTNLYQYTRDPLNRVDPLGLSDDVKPIEYRSPTQIPGTGAPQRVEVSKISEGTGQPYTHVSHYDDQGRLIGQTHYTDHGRSDHTNPHHHVRDPATGERMKSPNGTRVWPGPHPAEEEEKQKGCD